MWPDTLFISPVPNIRFLFFQSCLLSSLSAKQLLPFFFSAGAAPILISICGYWKRRLFFNWPTFVTRCCCQKNLELIFRTLVLVSGNFAFQFRNISFALRYFPLGQNILSGSKLQFQRPGCEQKSIPIQATQTQF